MGAGSFGSVRQRKRQRLYPGFTEGHVSAMINQPFSLTRMPSLGKIKDLYKIQREAKRIKKELKNVHVEAEASGVKVIVSAEQEIVGIEIAENVSRERLPDLLKDALNRALKKAQVYAAERMQGVMEQMGLPVGEGEAE